MRFRKASWALIIWTVFVWIATFAGRSSIKCYFSPVTTDCGQWGVNLVWLLGLIIWVLGVIPIAIVWYLSRPEHCN
jgi:hypothetical protein